MPILPALGREKCRKSGSGIWVARSLRVQGLGFRVQSVEFSQTSGYHYMKVTWVWWAHCRVCLSGPLHFMSLLDAKP